MFTRYLILLTLAVPLQVSAEKLPSNYVPPPSVITTEGMVQMVIGLLLVLATIGLVAWLLKRFAILPSTTSGMMKVVATIGVGQRERVVIVEIGEIWLVLGVAQGHVNTLHSMEKAPTNKAEDTLKNFTAEKFSEQLNQSLNKNNEK
ncbi:MAG: flagellar biosynthetic protein FliO [Nitrosomonas sp.]|nr:flagellar biosynthetic protein FliO [Nitrosomonas sp.]